MAEQTRFLDISDYWHMVRRRLWLPIVFAVIIAGLAAAFIVTKTPTYLARAKVQVQPIVTPSDQLGGPARVLGRARHGDRGRDRVFGARSPIWCGIDLTSETTAKTAPERPPGRGDRRQPVMYIGYEDPDPDAAQTLANAFAKAYLENRIAAYRDTFDKRIDVVESRIDDEQARYDAAGRWLLEQALSGGSASSTSGRTRRARERPGRPPGWPTLQRSDPAERRRPGSAWYP